MTACFSYFICELWSFQSNTIKSLLCLESRYATIQISDKLSSSVVSRAISFHHPHPETGCSFAHCLPISLGCLTYEINSASSHIKKFFLVVPTLSLVPSVFITFTYLTTATTNIDLRKITFLRQLLRGD